MTAGDSTPDSGTSPSVYLDYQATTPVDDRVMTAMLPFFTGRFGNPHSTSHAFGRDAEGAVDAARARIAALIGAEAREIIFTSGATESNNLAIKGAARFHRAKGNHVIVSAIEHKCVLESARRLELEGFSVTVLPVGPDGRVGLDALDAAIGEQTILVSIMAANNEIGVLQPVAEIGALCRKRHVVFHTDAAQAAGKVPLDVNAMQVDLMSLSAHKLYGPKGVGALYVRRRPRARLMAEMDGGGQERGMRSGTLPTPLCVGFGEACALAEAEMTDEGARLLGLRRRMLTCIEARIPDVVLNGHAEQRLAGNLNLAFRGVEGVDLMASVPELAISSGSACSSADLEPSYVLRALGLDTEAARGSVRICIGRFTTQDEIDFAAERIADAVIRLRNGESKGLSEGKTSCRK